MQSSVVEDADVDSVNTVDHDSYNQTQQKLSLLQPRKQQQGGMTKEEGGKVVIKTYRNDSLAHLISSVDRYAQALGVSVEQVQDRIAARQAATAELVEKLAAVEDGPMKHLIVCQHRYENGRHPFICPKCFSYLPICCCNELSIKKKTPLPIRSVILWTHSDEWGKGSNTGCILPLILENTHILMKGLHEEQLEQLLHPNDGVILQPVVLWPEVTGLTRSTKKTSASASTGVGNAKQLPPPPRPHERWDASTIAGLQSFDNIVLIAVEGTWRQARRMVSKLPYPRLGIQPTARTILDTDDSLPLPSLTTTTTKSLSGPAVASSWIEPLRKRSRNRDPSTVCTAQAVLLALEQCFGMDHDPSLEGAVKKKIDLTRRYRGRALFEEVVDNNGY